MRQLVSIVLVVISLLSGNTNAQGQLSTSISYTYLNAKEWDDIIRTYNFARPWREEEQPLLTHGITGSFGWYCRLSDVKSLFVKPQLSYSRFRSKSSSLGQDLTVTIQNFSFETKFQFNPRALFQDVAAGPLGTRSFFFIAPGITAWNAIVKSNKVLYLDSKGKKYAPINYNFYLSAGLGYRAMMLGKKWVVTPMIRCDYYPWAEIDNFAVAVQGSNQNRLKDQASNLLMFSGDLEFTRIIPVKSGRKGYGIGVPKF